MTILITGATGKTSKRLIATLASRPDAPQLLLASRAPSASASKPGQATVAFDWLNAATWPAVFSHSPAVTSAYLVPPASTLDLSCMLEFIDEAIKHGVQRFVLLSSTAVSEHSPFFNGPVHARLAQLGREGKLEWAVLRVSWFMENFSEQQHLVTINQDSAIYSATGDGRAPFVAAHDIASVAAALLTQASAPNRAAFVTGSQALTYDEVAAIFTDVLGRTIRHIKLSESDMAKRFEGVGGGMNAEYAQVLAGLDAMISRDELSTVSSDVFDITGSEPVGLREFVETNREVWKV